MGTVLLKNLFFYSIIEKESQFALDVEVDFLGSFVRSYVTGRKFHFPCKSRKFFVFPFPVKVGIFALEEISDWKDIMLNFEI